MRVGKGGSLSFGEEWVQVKSDFGWSVNWEEGEFGLGPGFGGRNLKMFEARQGLAILAS